MATKTPQKDAPGEDIVVAILTNLENASPAATAGTVAAIFASVRH